MILVDSSIWIELFNSKMFKDLSFDRLSQFVICPPVAQEVLQGIKNDSAFQEIKDGILSLPCLSNPVKIDEYLLGTDLYRLARKKGKTVRSSVDCLIAAIAINNNVPIWHNDRDFELLADISNLKIFELQ